MQYNGKVFATWNHQFENKVKCLSYKDPHPVNLSVKKWDSTQTDDSAHLVKTRVCRDGCFGTLHTSSGNLRTNVSAHIWLYGKPTQTASYTQSRAEHSKSKHGCVYNVVTN